MVFTYSYCRHQQLTEKVTQNVAGRKKNCCETNTFICLMIVLEKFNRVVTVVFLSQ